MGIGLWVSYPALIRILVCTIKKDEFSKLLSHKRTNRLYEHAKYIRLVKKGVLTRSMAQESLDIIINGFYFKNIGQAYEIFIGLRSSQDLQLILDRFVENKLDKS